MGWQHAIELGKQYGYSESEVLDLVVQLNTGGLPAPAAPATPATSAPTGAFGTPNSNTNTGAFGTTKPGSNTGTFR
jgi:hypothetical protein